MAPRLRSSGTPVSLLNRLSGLLDLTRNAEPQKQLTGAADGYLCLYALRDAVVVEDFIDWRRHEPSYEVARLLDRISEIGCTEYFGVKEREVIRVDRKIWSVDRGRALWIQIERVLEQVR